jgi:hypothetical protein
LLLLAGPELVKAETPTVDLEGSGDHLPVWPFAAHPIVEAGTIERSSLHFAEAVENLLRAKGQLGLEPFNEVGFNTSGKTEKVNESPLAPAAAACCRISGISCSLSPGMMGAMARPTSIPAAERSRMAANRASGAGAWGSSARVTSRSRNGIVK